MGNYIVYKGILEKNKEKTYVLVNTKNRNEAKKIANRYFRKKSNSLKCRPAYMDFYGDDECAFEKYEGAEQFWAVYK